MSNYKNFSPLPYPAWRCKSLFLSIIICALLLALFAAGFVLGRYGLTSRAYLPAWAPQVERFRIFWEAWDVIERRFYCLAPLNYQAMSYGAIRGMLASLGDRYTVFLEPPQHRLQTDTYKGDFGGIGILIAVRDGQAIVAEVTPDSPAERVGLQVGDALLTVDGQRVSGLVLDTIELLVRGEIGSSVQLCVQRDGQYPTTYTLVRERIELPSITWKLAQSDIGYVHIKFFSARTNQELSRAIQALHKEGVHALVLDLRGNGGGLIQGATDVLGQLIDHGIAFRELTKGGEERRYPVPSDTEKINWPLAVLVDNGTASSAEIVAAAIQDHKRGVLIGEPTFGKGSLQSVVQLSDESSVHVTIARWLSPEGHLIEGQGLQPDLLVMAGIDSQGKDMVLQRAIEYLQDKLGSACK